MLVLEAVRDLMLKVAVHQCHDQLCMSCHGFLDAAHLLVHACGRARHRIQSERLFG